MSRSLSAGLLVVACLTVVTTMLEWVRAQGSPTPTSPDIDQASVSRAGAPVGLSGGGAHATCGVVVLAASCVLAGVALWVVSPAYRRTVAGYLAIVAAAIGIAAIVWFLDDPDQQASTFGQVDLRSDTVETTPWPFVALCFLIVAGVVGVALVPREQKVPAPVSDVDGQQHDGRVSAHEGPR